MLDNPLAISAAELKTADRGSIRSPLSRRIGGADEYTSFFGFRSIPTPLPLSLWQIELSLDPDVCRSLWHILQPDDLQLGVRNEGIPMHHDAVWILSLASQLLDGCKQLLFVDGHWLLLEPAELDSTVQALHEHPTANCHPFLLPELDEFGHYPHCPSATSSITMSTLIVVGLLRWR